MPSPWTVVWCACFALYLVAAFRNANLVWGFLFAVVLYGTAIPIQGDVAPNKTIDWILYVGVLFGMFIYLRKIGRLDKRQREMREMRDKEPTQE